MGGLSMKKQFMGTTLLAAVVGLACLTAVLLGAFAPAVVLPKLDVPLLALLSLAPLALEAYLAPGARRVWAVEIPLAGIAFALLPWCAGLAGTGELATLFLLGAAVFGVCAFLFGSMAQRLSTGPASKLAPALSAFVLFLACQSLSGLPL